VRGNYDKGNGRGTVRISKKQGGSLGKVFKRIWKEGEPGFGIRTFILHLAERRKGKSKTGPRSTRGKGSWGKGIQRKEKRTARGLQVLKWGSGGKNEPGTTAIGPKPKEMAAGREG